MFADENPEVQLEKSDDDLASIHSERSNAISEMEFEATQIISALQNRLLQVEQIDKERKEEAERAVRQLAEANRAREAAETHVKTLLEQLTGAQSTIRELERLVAAGKAGIEAREAADHLPRGGIQAEVPQQVVRTRRRSIN